MKKELSILILLGVVFCATACSNSSSTQQEITSQNNSGNAVENTGTVNYGASKDTEKTPVDDTQYRFVEETTEEITEPITENTFTVECYDNSKRSGSGWLLDINVYDFSVEVVPLGSRYVCTASAIVENNDRWDAYVNLSFRCYDEDDFVIKDTSMYCDSVPKNGKAKAKTQFYIDEVPAKIELYEIKIIG